METTGYALTDLSNEQVTNAPAAAGAEESGYRYADGEQICESFTFLRNVTQAALII
jgi:hypothetical protein